MGTRLVAVIVTYNRLKQIQRTVARVLQETCDAVLVVDNGSSDGTREWLKSIENPRLHVLLPDENLGGAGGFEVGMRAAMDDHAPDWIVVMDDDARPLQGAFSKFLSADTTGWGAVAAAVYYPDGQICEMNRPAINPFWHATAFVRTLLGGGRRGFHLQDDAYGAHETTAIDTTSFVGMFIAAETIESIGYPDGTLFIYGDDVLYSLRIRKSGALIGFNPAIKFEHDCATFNGPVRAYRPYWKVYYNYRNGLMAYRAASGVFFLAALLVVIPKWIALGRHYGNDKPTYYRLLRHAIFDGLAGRTDRTHAEIVKLASGGQDK